LNLEALQASKEEVLQTEAVVNIDENRNVLSCVPAYNVRDVSRNWICNGPKAESITHDQFTTMKNEYLER
jgi:plasmid replication initiation protein